MHRSDKPLAKDAIAQRREDIKHARDVRYVYEQQLSRANELYMEVCAVRLQLEQRERVIAEYVYVINLLFYTCVILGFHRQIWNRYYFTLKKILIITKIPRRENALSGCRCGVRKNFKYFHRQTSSSSDGIKGLPALAENNRRRKKKQITNQPTQLVVNYVENNKNDVKTVTMALDDCITCACDDSVKNNNMTVTMKESVVEDNGNILVKDTCNDAPRNDNYVPELANV